MNWKTDDNDHLKLKSAIDSGGVRGVVALLNSLTPHRFTSLFRFDGDTLANVVFFDRENPTIEKSEDIPVEASYCVFVRDLGTPFTTEDSQRDGRVEKHPKRDVVKRYCGVPLLDRNGKMFGSICHFDFEPGRINEREVELLEYVGDLLQPRW